MLRRRGGVGRLGRAAALLALTLSGAWAAAQSNNGGWSDLESFRECESCPLMKVLPAGSFLMGSPETEIGHSIDEAPRRRVRLPRFAIGVYEATFAEWDACVADGYCRPIAAKSPRGRYPVAAVTWFDVTGEGAPKKGFLAWLNMKTVGSETGPYRLPSEAEWEYAARAGTRTAFSFGETDERLGDYGWFRGNSGQRARRVGLKKPNPWGLYDMHGNISEWVADCLHNSYRGAPRDGAPWGPENGGDCAQGVLRGGAWWFGLTENLRSAARDYVNRDAKNTIVGFRVVRTLETRVSWAARFASR
ncbi:MAG: formylglycine-generating enzyme family protein [Neomegalonema sp.]|nr:formylglycine-generating enzyme family protein [Neomegalonema sp.]